jgi:pimeloyl-ACP methyl ester carboxylesterase
MLNRCYGCWAGRSGAAATRYPRSLMAVGVARIARPIVALGLAVATVGCAPETVAPSSSTLATATPSANGPSPTVAAVATQPPARWSDCGGGFQCATLDVPRDYEDPSHGEFDISIIRLPAGEPDGRIGSLLVNPGGPGASGVEFVRDAESIFSRDLLERFDIVGFDPRGVNFSSRVRCLDTLDGHFAVDPTPEDARELDALVQESEAFADACAERNGAALPFLATANVARDLDQIRQAVGDDQITYLGFSYGTLLGATYAELFPDRIRAMALDGAIDPSLGLAEFRGDQGRAFEAALGRLFDQCAKDRECAFYEGGRPERAFDELMAQIDEEPIPAMQRGRRRDLGPGLAHAAVLSALYSPQTWQFLELGLAYAKRGDGSVLLAMSDPFLGREPDGTYSNLVDAYTANVCLDYPVPDDVEGFTAIADDLVADAPHFASYIAYNDLSCLFWSAPPGRTPAAVTAAEAPPIVVVGSTGDTATPYAWAEALAGQLESGVLVTREGEGHTGYSSRCVRDALDAYLVELEVPNEGLVCD